MDPLSALPPRSGYRRRSERVVGHVVDFALDLRQQALGIGRTLDRAAEESPVRRVVVLGVYGPSGAATMAAAIGRLRRTRHELRVAVGALAEPAPALADVTVGERMAGGRLSNLNRIAEQARPLTADWVLLIDDDVAFGRRFLDRLVCVAERFHMQLLQPALTRASHTAFPVTRRQPSVVRRTRLVEQGPVTLMHRDVFRELAPFPETGMGWGVCLHWAAVAERLGWRVGVADAVPARHDLRPPASGYDREVARRGARELLSRHEHITHVDAEQVLASYRSL
jgi:hypothetical protein